MLINNLREGRIKRRRRLKKLAWTIMIGTLIILCIGIMCLIAFNLQEKDQNRKLNMMDVVPTPQSQERAKPGLHEARCTFCREQRELREREREQKFQKVIQSSKIMTTHELWNFCQKNGLNTITKYTTQSGIPNPEFAQNFIGKLKEGFGDLENELRSLVMDGDKQYAYGDPYVPRVQFRIYPIHRFVVAHRDKYDEYSKQGSSRCFSITMPLNKGYKGGTLTIEGEDIPQEPGQATIFDASKREHWLSPITEGRRITLLAILCVDITQI